MKRPRYFVLFAVAAVISVVCAAVSSAPTDPFSVSISAPEQLFKVGGAVTIEVRITNTSEQEIAFSESSPECDFEVFVHRADGSEAPETKYKRSALAKCGSSTRDRLVRLRPTESFTDQLAISRIRSMAVPGRYTVQVKRLIPGLGRRPITSNTITIEIIE